ncbi:MAG: site-specific DNA-methyltransferase [Acidobacteria bacterium]|nr:site-specific DNA-methyltransferase [Acidobacteriota bacterium]
MTPYYHRDDVAIYHARCQDVFACGDAPVVQTLITDPPYFGMEYALSVLTGRVPYDEAQDAQWLGHLCAWYREWLPLCREMIEMATGRAWIFASPVHLPALARTAHLIQWPMRQCWFAPESEALVQFGRPVPEALAAAVGQAVAASRHPSRKEAAVLDAIVRASGDGAVLDPFAGHGGTLVAAKRAGLPAIGIDMDARACAAMVTAWEAA